jgi:hypothetical protein
MVLVVHVIFNSFFFAWCKIVQNFCSGQVNATEVIDSGILGTADYVIFTYLNALHEVS